MKYHTLGSRGGVDFKQKYFSMEVAEFATFSAKTN